MAGATFGRLMVWGDTFASINPFRLNPGADSGVGSKRLILGDPDFEDTPESFVRSPYNGTRTTTGSTAQGFAGNYQLAGYCRSNGVPVKRNVLVIPMDAPSLVIRSGYSDAITGVFQFKDIAQGQYIVMCIDPDRMDNCAVKAMEAAAPE